MSIEIVEIKDEIGIRIDNFTVINFCFLLIIVIHFEIHRLYRLQRLPIVGLKRVFLAYVFQLVHFHRNLRSLLSRTPAFSVPLYLFL